jgi:hypothetical protein
MLLVVLCLGVCGGTSGSGPAGRQVHRDELKEVLDEVELGMPAQVALAKFALPPVTTGDGCGGPDWRRYKFAEWIAGDYRIEIRLRHGRVIQKFIQANTN